MQGPCDDEKNENIPNRQKREQTIMQTGLQNDVTDQVIQNNPLKVSKKKEIAHDQERPAETTSKIHYDHQDNQGDEHHQQGSQPFKNLPPEPFQQKSTLDNDDLKGQTTDISFDKVYTSLEKLISVKNMLEDLGNKPNEFKPEDFKIPAEDMKNIENFVLSNPDNILNGLGTGLDFIMAESENDSDIEEDSGDSENSAYVARRSSSEVSDF